MQSTDVGHIGRGMQGALRLVNRLPVNAHGLALPLIGASALIASNLMLAVTLIALQRAAPSGALRTAVLMGGNFGVGLLLLVSAVSGRPVIPADPKLKLTIVLWSVCYCCAYGSFVLWPTLISPSLLIIGQALSPSVAVFISGDWRQSNRTRVSWVMSLSAMCLLILLALSDTNGRTSMAGLLAFCALLVCFLGSQTAARIATKAAKPMAISVRLSSLNGALLVVILLVNRSSPLAYGVGWLFRCSALLAIAIAAIQVLYLIGLRMTDPIASGLLISTSIPITAAAQALAYRRFSPSSMTLAFLYFLCVAALTWEAYRSRVMARSESPGVR